MTHSSNQLEIVFLSEDAALASVVQALPENPYGTRVFPRPQQQGASRAVRGAVPSRPAEFAPHERGESGGSAPLFCPLRAARVRETIFMLIFILFPCLRVAPSTVIPAEFICHLRNAFYTQDLGISRGDPAPHYAPQKKTDFPGSSWPYRDDSTGPGCDHGTAEPADHSGFPTGGGTCGP